ncbi:MAG TPA: hypothetical protein VMA95_07855 [Streptosporangiaceae bacterium]|nr:hypothetical protein [Streptosporangiaceae bacterium]
MDCKPLIAGACLLASLCAGCASVSPATVGPAGASGRPHILITAG